MPRENAAQILSMNFLVHALGVFGFFVSGFALMCGGLNGTAIGGPVTLGGTPTLSPPCSRSGTASRVIMAADCSVPRASSRAGAATTRAPSSCSVGEQLTGQ